MSASRQKWLALVLFAVLAIAHTWPLASAPGRYSRNDNMDTQLNEWTMAWVAHQVVHDPVHLFDANIFYPEKHTLAFSEHLFVQGVMAMPLYWAGVSPVAAFNIILIVGLALTGWAMAIVMHRWTGNWLAAIVSGSLIAFNASTLSRLVHIQAMHLEFFPFMLLALDELLARPRMKAALGFAGWFVLEALTSMYFLVFIAIAAIAAVAVRPADWLRANRAAFIKYALLAAVVAVLLLTPFLLPYYHASLEQEHFTRDIREVARYSASWNNYLASAGTLHMETLGWSKGYATADYLFPGFAAIALTLVSLLSLTAIKDTRAHGARVWRRVVRAVVRSGVPALSVSLQGVSVAPGHPRRRAIRPDGVGGDRDSLGIWPGLARAEVAEKSRAYAGCRGIHCRQRGSLARADRLLRHTRQ